MILCDPQVVIYDPISHDENTCLLKGLQDALSTKVMMRGGMQILRPSLVQQAIFGGVGEIEGYDARGRALMPFKGFFSGDLCKAKEKGQGIPLAFWEAPTRRLKAYFSAV